ncbi:hypothetical protein TSUD_78310 [Trifolium subterraneum]|uniref:HAT C-terminal dimerisation domain-containing protein n=1 Tax=Trifolium subterraneum TaxID=3900 RepID=A0A2Z6LS78_TRISU|nr:hypothetical protein TSUD_78310 [Trifolium subterraneum]
MDHISERRGVENECQILQTCNSANYDGDREPPNKKLKIDKYGKEVYECKTCGKVFTCGGRSGISRLNQHILVCPLVMKSHIAEHFKLKKIDHMMVRESITQMTIKHYLPSQLVEWDKFRAFTKFVSHNEAEFLSRNTVVADVMKVYLLEKDKLKKQLAAIEGSVCLSFRCWNSSASSHGYFTLTAHFMDDEWNLIVKLLNFCHFDPSHDNFELSRKVIGCLQEWGIERNIFSITIDNASANDDGDLQNLKNQLCSLDSLLRTFITSATGPSLEKHFKCCAHVLDLMVQESLKVVSDVLDKIRNSLKYLSVSESRLKQFCQCVEEGGGSDDSDGLYLDVPGKWVSTYMMLKSAIKYRSAFERMCLKDTTYNCPSSEEWERGEKICEFLMLFYELTTIISQSTYPTSLDHLNKFCGIEFLLRKMMLSEDDKIRDMASKMSNEYDKYFSEYSMILAFGCVLNPCLKFESLEYLYERLGHDTETVKAKVSNVRKALYTLFNEYANKVASTSTMFSLMGSRSSSTTLEKEMDSMDLKFQEYLEKKRQKRYEGGVTQLDLYLKETDRYYKNPLEYWKYRDHNYGILERMARDVFSIPIITVASESAFSPGSCILNKYRNSMVSENLQALVCSHNWLFGFSPSDQSEDEFQKTRIIDINLSKQDSKCHCVNEIKTDD